MAASNSPAEQLITENIDIWTSAIKKRGSQGRGSNKKIELYGIKKLRELILELAVRGLLVPQDPNDEPASVLLEKIAAEKEQLIKDGEIKKQKALPEVSDEVISFQLPRGWVWAKFDDIGSTNIGLTYKPSNVTEHGIPVLRSSNIQKNKICLRDLVRVSEIQPKSNSYIENGDLLICARNGSKSLVGKAALISDLSEPMVFGAFMAIFRCKINSYLHMFLSSPLFRRQLEGVNTTTINQITQSNLRSTLTPIPPEAEQPRIVAKVDELMALCDQLEQQTETSLSAHQTLVETLLNTLLNADQNSFDQAWERIAQHFDILFTTEHSIDQLKQTILQLAVMGKLVPQDPNEEPASVLLEKIAAEKEQLIKDKKIKLQKKAQVFEQSIKYESLPKGWEAVDFGDITFNRDAERIPLSVSDRNMRKGEYDYYGASGVIDNIDNYLFDKPLLLIGEDGANLVNRSTPIAFMAYGKYWVNNHAHVLDGITEQFLIYISLYINSISLLPYITGMAQPKMNQAKMNSILVLLPPENEQIRIITKVNELVTLCESMKTQIRETQTTQLHLADAMAEQALN